MFLQEYHSLPIQCLQVWFDFRVARSSLPTWWTCCVSRAEPDLSRPRRSNGWSESFTRNLTRFKCSWNSRLVRQWWSSAPGSWTPGESAGTSARSRARCWTSTFTPICPTPTPARRQRRSSQGSVELLYLRYTKTFLFKISKMFP